jgi:hypothetical protein
MLQTPTGRVPCRPLDLRCPDATRGSLKRRIFGANIADISRCIMSASGFLFESGELSGNARQSCGIFDVIEV